MVKNKLHKYFLLSSIGFVVVIAIGFFLQTRLRNIITQYRDLSKNIHNENIEHIHKVTLANMAEYMEKHYPFLHDTQRLKDEAGTEWFWDTADEWREIADVFGFAYIHYIEKNENGYRFLFSSDIRRDYHPERLHGRVWTDAPPAFYDEAWETKQLTVSPEPYSYGKGVLITAARPIISSGEVVGILGVDYDVTYVESLRRQELQLEGQEGILLDRMRKILFAAAGVILLLMCYQVWLGNTAVLVPMRAAEADERTRLMMEATPMMCSLWDTDGSIIDCDGETLKIMGLSGKSDYLDHFFDLNPEYQPNGENTRSAVSRVIGEVLETGYRRFEWLTRTRTGELLPVEVTVVRVPWRSGSRLAVYSRDLREEKARDAALQETENRLRIMLDTMVFACMFFDFDGNLIDCNQRTVDLFGYEHTTEMLGKFKDLSPEYQPDGRRSQEKAMEFLAIAIDTGKSVFHWIHQKRDGTQLPAEVTLIRVAWKDSYRVVAYVRDLSKLVETEDNLRRVLATVESSPNIVLNIDENGYIEYMNPAFIGISGFTREELQKDGLALIFNPDDYDRFFKENMAAALKNKKTKFEMKLTVKNGGELDFAFSAFAVQLNDGSTGVGMLGRDVTELKRMHLDLAAAKEQAEKALASEIQYNKAKSDFLSRVSHELRTPLNIIAGMTSIAKTTSSADEFSYCWDNIDEATEHLLELVNDILDLTGFDTGRFNFYPCPFNFSKALASVIDIANRKALARGQIFVADIDHGIREWMISDERRLKQILLKLLSNAVKFTPEKGKIELHARMIEDDEKECMIRFEIVDNGIGISPEMLERMGDVFEQADNSTTREYGGMGLSLTLTKRIVDLMRGELKVESEEGKGSRFICDVRFDSVTNELGDTNTELQESLNSGGVVQEASADLTGKRIMIVDDVSLNREILLMLLEDTGAILDEASTGDEAVRMFGRDKYDLILMDLHMPVMDGYTATKNIRASAKPWAKSVPVIAISAESSGELYSKCNEVGINDYLAKPVKIEDLLRTIAKWMPSGRQDL